MDHDHEVIGKMFYGRHALMLVNGAPTNVHTGQAAFVPPPGVLHQEHTAHAAAEPEVVDLSMEDTGPIPRNGNASSAETALDTLSGFRWRAEGE